MPTYRYRCEKCGEEIDVRQSFDEKPLTKHTGECKGKLVRVLAPAGIVLKGSGFYRNDSRSNGKPSDRKSKESKEPKEASPSSATSDTKSDGDTKTESTSSTSSASSGNKDS